MCCTVGLQIRSSAPVYDACTTSQWVVPYVLCLLLNRPDDMQTEKAWQIEHRVLACRSASRGRPGAQAASAQDLREGGYLGNACNLGP